MDQSLYKTLSDGNLDSVLLSAIDRADTVMRKYIWRGFKPRGRNLHQELMVGDKSAGDFVNEALRRLCDGIRKYDGSRTLLENINSAVDSLIWSEKKSSDRTGIVDHSQGSKHTGIETDPLSHVQSSSIAPDDQLTESEVTECQTKAYGLFREAYDGDSETQNYLDALKEGFFDIKEISEITGIPVDQIYEIRRKLKLAIPQFFGVKNYEELRQKIREGK